MIDTYGEWPDYVDDVVSGEIWLCDPFCPGWEEVWVRGESYKSEVTGMTWWKYTRREVNDDDSVQGQHLSGG